MNHRNPVSLLRTTLILAVASAGIGVAGCQDSAESLPIEDTVMLSDGELQFEGSDVVASLSLGNGSEMHFVEFAQDNLAVLLEEPAKAKPLAFDDLEASAELADVFYAFSKPGEAIPKRLLEVSTLTATEAEQGWARATAVTQEAQTSGACNDTRLRNWVNSFNYNDRGTPKFRMNKVPDTSGFFQEDANYAPGNGVAYRFFDYVVNGTKGSIFHNVDRFVSRVAVCAIDTYEPQNPASAAHPAISFQGLNNTHMGPVVAFGYRLPGGSTWNWPAVKDFASYEVGTTLSWHFNTGANWDWQTKIYWAGGDDSFDIGHAVEDLGL
jgi:hypothetical protein